jgi:hypothetical protein
MNIFFLSLITWECAQYHCDKHVVKMILELTQLLWSAHHVTNSSHLQTDKVKVYKKTHVNHPMAIWTRISTENYAYVCDLALELCKEYTYRYRLKNGGPKTHACQPIIEYLQTAVITPTNEVIKEPSFGGPSGCTPPPFCVKEKNEKLDLVSNYRNYYITEKSGIAKWTNRPVPDWFVKNE